MWSVRKDLSYLRSRGHLHPDEYALGRVFDEVALARERDAAELVRHMSMLRNMVVSCFDEKGYKEVTEHLRKSAFTVRARDIDG